MDRVLIVADDLTGALDSGVKFAQCGIQTCVCIDINSLDASKGPAPVVKVLVVPSRHVSPAEAYEAVYKAVKQNPGFTVLVKKTDSALRGNVGAELAAVRDAAHVETVYFLPAFPQMNRITRGGVQYINGEIPVAESVFGTDPFNPVTDSYVPKLLNQTTDTPAYSGMRDNTPGIAVLDAETEEEMLKTVCFLVCQRGARVLGGCAGLTGVLPKVLDLDRNASIPEYHASRMPVFCGSVNPVSLRQCRRAEQDGVPLFHLIQQGQEDEIVASIVSALENHCVVAFDTGSDQTGVELEKGNGGEIAQKVGRIICGTMARISNAIPFIIGGDTLLAFLNQLGIQTIFPVKELLPGVVLARYPLNGAWQYLVSKSGGFGEPDLLKNIARQLINVDIQDYAEVKKYRC